jgi:alkanesulfonate monooxygenase SsuD/methylene tetrahydromethanopterin reductase-like flavin-dependent oxidoreductase (luciferase family)
MLRVGLTLPSFQSEPDRVLAVARAAEEAGLDGVFAFDHLFRRRGDAPEGARRPALELLTMTAAVAAATERIMVGTLVARATLRPPATLRAAFDTLARIAPGRFIAGLGGGDDESVAEDRAFGVLPGDPPPAGGWPGPGPSPGPGVGVSPGPGAVSPGPSARAAGSPGSEDSGPGDLGPYRLARLEAAVEALASRAYPVWVAGRSPAALRLAAGRADGWNRWGGDAAAFAAAADRMRQELAAAGRDPVRFTSTWGGLAVLAPNETEARAKRDRLGGDRPGVVWGGPSQVAETIAGYAAAGAAWVILGPIDSSNPANASLLGEASQLL